MADRDLHVVPPFLIDACEDIAARDAAFRQVWFRFQRWKAHTLFNPSLLAGPLQQLDHVAAQLRHIRTLLEGTDILQHGAAGLDSVDPDAVARKVETDMGRRDGSRIKP